jgi:sirohydrochlorin cobaltochelatase
VAGEHARQDLAGPEAGSWASRFKAAGHRVEVHLEGLGSLEAWADLYIEHIRRGLSRLKGISQ